MIKKLLAAAQREVVAPPPVWLMRQAGRYLPEYRAVRQKAGGFLDLCFNPELAAEVTLQPIRRFDFDAAIIFADILLLPYALGRDLKFLEGEGPKLEPLRSLDDMVGKNVGDRLDPVYEALRRVKLELAADKALIGFCGAPWTVGCYVIEGGGSKDFGKALTFARERRQEFLGVLDKIAVESGDYLCRQIAAGADAVQIFDSWAGLVPAEDFGDFVIRPTRKIVARVKAEYPDVPVIGFPRAAGALYGDYAQTAGVDVLGLDQGVGLDQAATLQKMKPVQGNLAPELLLQGGAAMRQGIADILARLGGGPLIFNLGHGITPDVPPEHVAELVACVRGFA